MTIMAGGTPEASPVERRLAESLAAETGQAPSLQLERVLPSWRIFPSPEISFRLEEFGVQHGSPRSPPNSIVRKHGEFPIEHIALPQTTDGSSHACSQITVEARLRTIGGGHVHDWLPRRTWQPQLLRLGAEIIPLVNNLFGARLLLQANRNGFRVPIFHSNTIALRAHRKRSRIDPRPVQRPQQLLRLLLHFLFFIGDVRDHVAKYVERSNAWISRAADRLHRDRHDCVQGERAMQRRKGQHQSDRGTVRIRDHKSLRLRPPRLLLNQRNVIAVDLWNYQRHVVL